MKYILEIMVEDYVRVDDTYKKVSVPLKLFLDFDAVTSMLGYLCEGVEQGTKLGFSLTPVKEANTCAE